MAARAVLACLGLCLGGPAMAEGPSLFGAGGGARGAGGSLFAGSAGLFAPRDSASAEGVPVAAPAAFGTRPGTAGLFDLIAAAEAGPDGYDAVQHGARHRPALPPTRMTLGQILDWIEATPGQPHAIGRYQIIPATLRGLMQRLQLDPGLLFDPALQDRLATRLIRDAGYDAFAAGRIGRHAFMNNLARVWAGLPTSSGQSHYHGHAGNRATMTWARFEAGMQAIFPGSRA